MLYKVVSWIKTYKNPKSEILLTLLYQQRDLTSQRWTNRRFPGCSILGPCGTMDHGRQPGSDFARCTLPNVLACEGAIDSHSSEWDHFVDFWKTLIKEWKMRIFRTKLFKTYTNFKPKLAPQTLIKLAQIFSAASEVNYPWNSALCARNWVFRDFPYLNILLGFVCSLIGATSRFPYQEYIWMIFENIREPTNLYGVVRAPTVNFHIKNIFEFSMKMSGSLQSISKSKQILTYWMLLFIVLRWL